MNRLLIAALLLFGIVPALAQSKKQPTPVIFDSDMGPDYDDVGAITLLHAFADSGYIRILGTTASTKYEGVAAVFNVLNTYFGRPGLPIGVPKGDAVDKKDWQHWTDTLVARYPHRVATNAEVPDAVALYRQLLSAEPDQSVVIITVGFLTNLAQLLETAPDQWSPLTGRQLVRRKVKRLVSMAGKFPAGKEFNVELDAAAARKVVRSWPTEIIFSGFEIGQKIKTGLPLVQADQITGSPVKDVFRICLPMAKEDHQGRMSWDETAVLVAVKGIRPFYRLQKGRMVVHPDGFNRWDRRAAGHYYLVEDRPPSEVERLLNRLMMHQPVTAN